MGLYNRPNFLMNEIVNGLDDVRTYINDPLIISIKSLEDNTEKLEKVLSILKSAGFKVNAKNSFFAKNELEY